MNSGEESAIADIFGAITRKKQQRGNDSSNNKNNNKNSGNISGNSGTVQSGTSKNSDKPTGDGLYHAPEKTLELSDAAFFDLSSLRQKGCKKKKSTTTEVPEDVLRREGVDRVITLEELQKITSSNPKAGTTPNCPFDCDCCF
ncbi:hypothetical protein DQ04_01291100 [Trypanosoma grayi]|uniref:hypothetical protein n=1 Tax=Trypanosoma grayi TaxID=71804 RepID=UPI0004F43C56|nr:hypothetical protein DQ04_01291100 [Trypanosoma grayi]KEG12980.1 hypothetical protein DQ04_01291100 [Trypanosoma grayi]